MEHRENNAFTYMVAGLIETEDMDVTHVEDTRAIALS